MIYNFIKEYKLLIETKEEYSGSTWTTANLSIEAFAFHFYNFYYIREKTFHYIYLYQPNK